MAKKLPPPPQRILAAAIIFALSTLAAHAAPTSEADNQAKPEAETLPTVVISGSESYNEGQISADSNIGILGKKRVIDTPFNVTTYTAKLIKNQQARTLEDVLTNDPSVRFTTSQGHMYENFRIRGFDVNSTDVAINGMFGLSPEGHVPVEFIEQVQVLKGPSALYSGMAPGGGVGGVVDITPKRATDDAVTEGTLGYTSDALYGAHVDVGRRFGIDKKWGVRVNAAYANGDTTLDGQSKKREFASAALDYRGTNLNATMDAYHSQESYKGGTPAMFWFAGTAIPQAPDPAINQFKNGYGKLESNAVILRGEYAFNDKLTAFAGVGVKNYDYSGFINGTHARNIKASGDYTGNMIGQLGYLDSVSAEAGLRGKFNTDGLKHEAVLHLTNLDQEGGSTNTSASFSSNIYHPIATPMVALPTAKSKTGETTLSSVALMDTVSFLNDKVQLTLGARNQQVKTKSFSATNGAQTANYDKSAVTPAIALLVKPWGDHVSLYANYVQGLSKGDEVTDTKATNYKQIFAPYKTDQKELGVKWDARGFTNTLALFEINKPILVSIGNSNNPTYTDGGEKRVRGLEWNTFGNLTDGLRLLGGATYTQGTLTKTAYNLNNGKTAVGAPRWQANLGLEWDTPWLRDLTLSGRVQSSSNQYLDAANTQKIPGWAQYDFGARYLVRINDARKLTLNLNIINLFDRHYYSGSFSDTTPIATLGPKRTVSLSATMNF